MTNKPDSEYTLGVDISKYDVVFNDYTKQITSIWNPDNSSKRIDFVIQRGSYGIHKDQFLEELYQQVLKIKIRGYYHYFSSGLGWQKQLAVILDASKDKSYHFFAIDYEKIYNDLDNTSFAEMMELAKQLKLATKKKVILYFNADVYQNYMKPYGADNVINSWDVWFAQYPYIQYLDLNNLPPLLPKNIKTCKLYQFAGDIQGTRGYGEGNLWGTPAKSMDISLFYGTVKEMEVWANTSDVIIPPPTPITITKIQVLPTTVSLNVRSQPILTSSVLYSVPSNTILDCIDDISAINANLGITGKWLKIKTKDDNFGYVAAWFCRKYIETPIPPTPINNGILFRIKTDMELHDIYGGIQTNYHSRTLLPEYKNVFGGITPSTMPLKGGIGDVALSANAQKRVADLNYDK